MFKISKQVDYAVRLLRALESLPKGQILSLKRFSKESTISFLFLQRIARRLRSAGLITSKQGAQGGYCLLVPIKDISLQKLIEIVDEPTAPVACLDAKKGCRHEHGCVTKPMFEKIHKQMIELLENTMLTDF